MRLPWVGDGLSLLRNPTAFFERERQRRGDTFTVDAFGYRLFCVFSPMGAKALYGLAERDASFGLATYRLIGFKLPPELLDGRRNTSHSLFGAQDVERYLDNLDAAVSAELDELGGEVRSRCSRRCAGWATASAWRHGPDRKSRQRAISTG